MINGNVNAFIGNLHFGTEMYFIYKGKKYFIQGWVENGIHYLVLDYDYETEIYDPSDSNCTGYIWEYSSADSNECVKAFLNAPIWDGKRFCEVEKEIEWTD